MAGILPTAEDPWEEPIFISRTDVEQAEKFDFADSELEEFPPNEQPKREIIMPIPKKADVTELIATDLMIEVTAKTCGFAGSFSQRL